MIELIISIIAGVGSGLIADSWEELFLIMGLCIMSFAAGVLI